MASFTQNRFQQFLQQSSSQPQQSNLYRDMYNSNTEGQISQQIAYFNTPNLPDHHPPSIPSFQCTRLALGPAHEENNSDIQWIFGLEQKTTKWQSAQVFSENNINLNNSSNSQMSSLDLFNTQRVSTGLGLSLDHPRLACSLGDSALLGIVGDALDQELQRQDAEIDRYIKLQGERLRRALVDKFEATQRQTMSYIKDKIVQKLQEKESEVEAIHRRNAELELRTKQLASEADAWQQHARRSENTINALQLDLQQAHARCRRGRNEDGEIEDSASCCNGRSVDSRAPAMAMCRGCGASESCMLLLPCKHVCVCKGCEERLSVCPICLSSKYIGMEVYM